MRVLVVDDHPSVMEGTRAMLEREPGFSVAACAAADEAMALIREDGYDVMLFDLYMPETNGLELTKRVLAVRPEAAIVIYTGSDIAPLFNKLVDAGVTGFLSKTASREQLVTAIRCAARGEAVVPATLLRELRRETVLGGRSEPEGGEHGLAALLDKEVEMLRYIARGKSNREMADELLMSQRSLEYGLTRLFQKLKVHSRIEALAKVRELGIPLHDDLA